MGRLANPLLCMAISSGILISSPGPAAESQPPKPKRDRAPAVGTGHARAGDDREAFEKRRDEGREERREEIERLKGAIAKLKQQLFKLKGDFRKKGPTEAHGPREVIRVEFDGAGTGADEGRRLSGHVEYDSSKSGLFGVFDFRDSMLAHKIHFEIDDVPVTAAQSDGEPFQIVTNTNDSGGDSKLMRVEANVKESATSVQIRLPTELAIYDGQASAVLPGCRRGDDEVFTAAPRDGTATFSLAGGTNFTGMITGVRCRPSTRNRAGGRTHPGTEHRPGRAGE